MKTFNYKAGETLVANPELTYKLWAAQSEEIVCFENIFAYHTESQCFLFENANELVKNLSF